MKRLQSRRKTTSWFIVLAVLCGGCELPYTTHTPDRACLTFELRQENWGKPEDSISIAYYIMTSNWFYAKGGFSWPICVKVLRPSEEGRYEIPNQPAYGGIKFDPILYPPYLYQLPPVILVCNKSGQYGILKRDKKCYVQFTDLARYRTLIKKRDSLDPNIAADRKDYYETDSIFGCLGWALLMADTDMPDHENKKPTLGEAMNLGDVTTVKDFLASNPQLASEPTQLIWIRLALGGNGRLPPNTSKWEARHAIGKMYKDGKTPLMAQLLDAMTEQSPTSQPVVLNSQAWIARTAPRPRR